MKDMKIFVIAFFLAILLGISFGKVNASPRFSSCYGLSCNYKDPALQGCSAITANAAWAWGSSGQVRTDLRWSNSSDCYSNWSRATKTYPYYVTRHIKAYLTDYYENNRVTPTEYYYGTQIWTDMYSGAYYNCALAKMGMPGSGPFDAETVKACG